MRVAVGGRELYRVKSEEKEMVMSGSCRCSSMLDASMVLALGLSVYL